MTQAEAKAKRRNDRLAAFRAKAKEVGLADDDAEALWRTVQGGTIEAKSLASDLPPFERSSLKGLRE